MVIKLYQFIFKANTNIKKKEYTLTKC